MKIIKNSGVNHWVHLQDIDCNRCASVFRTETERDYSDYGNGLWVTCPVCTHRQRVYREWKFTPRFTWGNTSTTTNYVGDPSWSSYDV